MAESPPRNDEVRDSALAKAVAWLVAREVRVRGDWAVKNPAPEASGWAFEYRNDFYPDTDDTMMVLLALQAVEGRGSKVRGRFPFDPRPSTFDPGQEG